jgi:hypothetical protein
MTGFDFQKAGTTCATPALDSHTQEKQIARPDSTSAYEITVKSGRIIG